MINKACLDQLDEAVDCFEEQWTLKSRNEIRSILQQFDLADDCEAITELIRIDIELRYQRGLSIQLEDYLEEFGTLNGHPGYVAQIAFEDFRARTTHGHPVPVSRWRGIAGIEQESWFQELSQSRRNIVISRHVKEVDPTFERALEQIGFRLVHEIGRGALSQVFLATQNELADRYVVLKIVNQALSEPESMAMLQHTNIVPIYSFHRIAHRSVICMPYAGRVTLADFIKGAGNSGLRGGASLIETVRRRIDASMRRREFDLSKEEFAALDESNNEWSGPTPAADENAVLLPLEQLRAMSCNQLALWLFQRIAAGLAHSHGRGVLHGDLKPENVLIRNDGEPALLDFNLSHVVDGRKAELAGGTLPYMSPETYRALMGQDIKPSRCSDIYSVGVMMYEFVTGDRPYPAPSTSAAVDLEPAVAARRQPIIWRDNEKLSAGTRAIIQRCLAFDPSQRYESAEGLQQDLDRELNDRPLVIAEESLGARIKKWARRHPKLTSGVSVASMLVALLIPLSLWGVTSHRKSVHLSAVTTMNDFENSSNEALQAWMADPLRYNDDRIEKMMQPLLDFGLLKADGLSRFDSPLFTSQERLASRHVILRHVGQVAFSELFRLRKLVAPGSNDRLDSETLARLDRLINLAEQISENAPSRAVLFIKAERATFAGDAEAGQALAKQAGEMQIDNRTETYLEALRMMANRRWAKATELLATLADHEDFSPSLRWTMLGRSQFEEKNYEDAKISFTQSIERAPKASRLRYLRGRCYLQLGQFDRAESDFATALELEPTLIVARTNRGISQLALSERHRRQEEHETADKYVELAIGEFTTGLNQAPENIELMIFRARAYKKAGDTNASQRDYQAALDTPLSSAPLLSKRARARIAHDDLEGALADLQKAIEIDQRSPSILHQLANVQVALLDKTEDAIETLTKLEVVDPGNDKAVMDRAVLHARLGDYTSARRDLRSAIRPPNSPKTIYQAACVNALLPTEQDHRKALMFLARAIQEGYGTSEIEEDSDLDAIREMDGFRAIQRTIRLSNGIRIKQQRAATTTSETP